MLRTADEIREAKVLVRRMVVRAVVRNAGAGNRWHADDLVEEPMGGGARRPRPDLRLPPVRIDGALDRGFHDPGAQGDGGGLKGLLRGRELDVAEPLRSQMLPEFRELRLLLHVRDQAEVDLRFRDRGVHGLRALLDVPTHEAANRASRGIDQAPEQLEIAPAADEFGDAPELFEGLRLEGARAQVPQLAGARAPRVRVPAGDLDSTLRVAQRHERVNQPPRRVRRDRRVRRVLVHFRGAAAHLDVEDAFASELDLRRALVEVIAALDRRALRPQDLLVRVHEGDKMRAPDLFLPLDDELQIDRRPPFDGLPRLDREELHDQVAFRVRAAATPELAFLDRGTARIPRPFVQRVDGLDVVMLVHQQRWLAFVDDHLDEDDVRAALRRDLAGLEAALGEETPHQGGRLRLGQLVGTVRRESDVFLEDFEGFLRVGLDAGQDIRERYAPHPPPVSRPPHKNPTSCIVLQRKARKE